MDIAILLLVWKRPNHTRLVIDSLRLIAPTKIYISSDGPISGDEDNKKLVELVRLIVLKEIDWECEIFTNFCKINKGCKKGVSDGISWFFNYENEGIILEDDCLPSKDFFEFCSILLNKYRDDKRIWAICGNGFISDKFKNKESYFFSRYVDVWGWATWKRCWQLYDSDIKKWEEYKKDLILEDIFENKRHLNYWKRIFDKLFYQSLPDTWDYQWQFTCFLNSGLVCKPYKNLVKNIGFDKEATHTKLIPIHLQNSFNKDENLKFPLIHPSQVIRSKRFDDFLENIHYSGYKIFSRKGLFLRVKKIFSKSKNFLSS